MNDDRNSGGLPRRQFVALSGAVGAAALMTAAGAARSAAASDPCNCSTPPGANPCSDPCNCSAPPGANPCPPANLQTICGSLSDTDPLWYDVRYCTTGTPPPKPQPKPQCLNMTSNYVVLHGKPLSTNHYLLLPSCRITGIECPFLESPVAANYWPDAWDNARPGGKVPVIYPHIGLGINSQRARRFQQMHIHMAGVHESTQRRLQDLESNGRVALQPSHWNDTQYRAPITGSAGDRTYRVLLLPSLSQNLFALLDQYVVTPSQLKMADQTLIVVPKKTAAGYMGGFYVLNSDESLHDGTDTCDYLLVYT